jgi:hypothetical protein
MLFEGFLQGINAEAGIERVGDAPRQHFPRVSVHDRDQIHKAPRGRDIRVGSSRGAVSMVEPDPFPLPAHRTGRARLHASGSPRD